MLTNEFAFWKARKIYQKQAPHTNGPWRARSPGWQGGISVGHDGPRPRIGSFGPEREQMDTAGPQSASLPGMRRSEPILKPPSPDVSNWTSRVDRDRPRCPLFPSDQTGLPGHFSSGRQTRHGTDKKSCPSQEAGRAAFVVGECSMAERSRHTERMGVTSCHPCHPCRPCRRHRQQAFRRRHRRHRRRRRPRLRGRRLQLRWSAACRPRTRRSPAQSA